MAYGRSHAGQRILVVLNLSAQPQSCDLPGISRGRVLLWRYAEVQLGKIAAEKGSSKQVKEFGPQMQQDHGKANESLKKLAAKKGVQLPTDLEGKHKASVDKLSKMSGDEFDREYMRAMVDDHKETLEKFQREADNGKDADVKKFASEHVPILKKHLELAQTTQSKSQVPTISSVQQYSSDLLSERR